VFLLPAVALIGAGIRENKAFIALLFPVLLFSIPVSFGVRQLR
jgi:hypothetical protein